MILKNRQRVADQLELALSGSPVQLTLVRKLKTELYVLNYFLYDLRSEQKIRKTR
jgi:hypothetical protein